MSKVVWQASDYVEPVSTPVRRTYSFARYIRECERLKLAVDMELAASSNRLDLFIALKEIGERSDKGEQKIYFTYAPDVRIKTLAQLLALGAQLRVEGFHVVVIKDRWNNNCIYLEVSW